MNIINKIKLDIAFWKYALVMRKLNKAILVMSRHAEKSAEYTRNFIKMWDDSAVNLLEKEDR